MPRDHGRIWCSIWNDADFRRLTAGAQRLYMLILSQKHLNHGGVIPLMMSKWAKGCESTTVEDIQADLEELQAARFVFFDEDTEEAFVRTFIRGDGVLKQPNVLKNALRCVLAIESPRLRCEAAVELRRIGRKDTIAVADQIDPGEPFDNPSETLPEGFDIPSGTLEPFRNPSGTPREPQGVGVGEGEKVTSGVTHLEKKSAPRAHARARVRREPIRIPDQWAPSPVHQAKAGSLGVDLAYEAEQFRQHALSVDRHQADWDAAFHTWLGKAKPRKPPNGSTTDERVAGGLSLAARYRAQEAQESNP